MEAFILTALWTIIYGYMIAASIDFGISFYIFYGYHLKKMAWLYEPLKSWQSPVSELMNIGFILLFTALVGWFPELVLNFQTPLVICGVLALFLTVFKGTFFALSELMPKQKNGLFLAGNGIAGIFVPLALSIVLVISEGGFSSIGTGKPGSFVLALIGNVYFWSVMVLVIVSIFYISTMHLVHFSSRIGSKAMTEHFRNLALFLSMPMVVSSGLVFLGLERQNPDHFMRTLDLWWLFMLSLFCLLLSVTFVFIRRYRGVLTLVALQYFFAFFGYTASHMPYLIYPDIVISGELDDWAHSEWFFLAALLLAPSLFLWFLSRRERTVLRVLADQEKNE
ncbi:cytochrome d ubiquinol oxidase subunit II [Sporolactobacillus sp. CPB3-1]|uniref:Cytochrome d ubiquinol oxidase subunit II n=1 Tax=Sporolactobacillus mangiferae TaxID=2940498 RepID=A0ABT0M7Z2_9BACL|nr:cytochrome d ubiquinol oxidase subunit II [Sporolactobacillus mangiferae]MCL1630986.1 cytochrome d ubiquinol oxidase subunit II [Sporolactobacillus mangiferae]